MTDRMNHYETLDTKVNNKINEVKHLTNYNSTEPCSQEFLCFSIKRFYGNGLTALDKIYLFIDLALVEAIDQEKQHNAFELILEVKK